MLICWLVVSNMILIFHNIWDVIFPIDELIFFKMVSQPPNFAGVFVWWTSNKSKKPATAGQEPFKLHVPDFFVLSLAAGPCPSPKNARSFGGAGDYRCFFQEKSSLGEDVCCQNWRNSCVNRLKLERTAVVCMCSRQHTLLPCAGSTFIHSYLRHVRRHPKPSARSAVAIKKTPGTIFWYPMELGKSSTLRGHTLW